MKLSEYARKNGISYQTAHRHWKAGKILGKQLPTGTIVIVENTKEELYRLLCFHSSKLQSAGIDVAYLLKIVEEEL